MKQRRNFRPKISGNLTKGMRLVRLRAPGRLRKFSNRVSGIKASLEGAVMDLKERLVELAKANVEAGGRPFSCLIVKDDVVLAEGVNRVAQTHDPTAHAEICAIREATGKLHTEH